MNNDALLASTADGALLNRWLFAGNRAQIQDVFVAGQQRISAGQHAGQAQIDADLRNALQALQ